MNTIFGMRLSIGRGLVLVGMFAAGVVSGQPCYVTGVDGPSCIEDGSVTLNAPATSPVVCIGDSVTVTATVTTEDDWNETVTHYDHCDDVIADGFDTPTYGVTWTATVGSYTTSGTGLTATFTPTDCGAGTATFSVIYTNASPCNDIGSSGTSGNFTVASVTSLTPSIPSGQGDLEDDSDPPTYWISRCAEDIIVTASSCPSLTVDQLPVGWSFTGGVEIDKLHHKVSAADLATGPVTFTVTCGTSTQTIILEADLMPYNLWYGFPSGGASCSELNWGTTLLAEVTDTCNNKLDLFCESGAFVYKYNGIEVGRCVYNPAVNVFYYRKTKYLSSFYATWHETREDAYPFDGKSDAYKVANWMDLWNQGTHGKADWTVNKYWCITGAGPTHNCREIDITPTPATIDGIMQVLSNLGNWADPNASPHNSENVGTTSACE